MFFRRKNFINVVLFSSDARILLTSYFVLPMQELFDASDNRLGIVNYLPNSSTADEDSEIRLHVSGESSTLSSDTSTRRDLDVGPSESVSSLSKNPRESASSLPNNKGMKFLPLVRSRRTCKLRVFCSVGKSRETETVRRRDHEAGLYSRQSCFGR